MLPQGIVGKISILPPSTAEYLFFRVLFSLILRSKINENSTLKNILRLCKKAGDLHLTADAAQ
jgi:hypothetical protein